VDQAELRQVLDFVRLLPEKIQEQVKTRALNAAARGMKIDASKLVRGKVNIRAKVAKAALHVARAARSKDYAELYTWFLRGIPLYGLSPIPKLPVDEGGKRPKKGVSVRIKTGREVVEGSFIARMKGNLGVWRRQGAARFPVEKPVYLDFAEILENPGVMNPLLKQGAERLEKETLRAIDYALLGKQQ